MLSMRSRHGGGQLIVAILAILAIAIAVYFIVKQAKSVTEQPEGDAYYYCEDCEKEFVGSSNLIPPIRCPKCGKLTAVRAIKFKGLDGKVFTGYYEKYDMESKRLIEAKRRGETVDEVKIRGSLIRDPEGDWVDSMSPEGAEIFNNVISPTDDSRGEDLQRVYPKAKKK